jgi:hypothetical protein
MILILFLLLFQSIDSNEPLLDIDFETEKIEFSNQWGGSYFGIVENPSISPVNESRYVANVYKYGRNVSPSSGIAADFPIDISKAKKVSLKVYYTGGNPFYLIMKLESVPYQGQKFTEYGKWISSTGEWIDVEFEISNTEFINLNRLSLFFDFGETKERDFYFDDVKIE